MIHPHHTPTQDRLARGKAPFSPPSGNSQNAKGKASAGASTQKRKDGQGGMEAVEMWEERARRDSAARVAGSWEMLAWCGIAEGESIPQTRLRFEKKMIGLNTEDSEDEWGDEVDGEGGEGRGGMTKAKERLKMKGSERRKKL